MAHEVLAPGLKIQASVLYSSFQAVSVSHPCVLILFSVCVLLSCYTPGSTRTYLYLIISPHRNLSTLEST